MSIVNSGNLSSEERPIELRIRQDLELTEAWYQSERSWVVKDPLALKYYRLREPEHVVFQMLDGRSSLRDIQSELVKRFPDRITRLADVQQLIGSLNKQGMLVSPSPGKAGPLLEQAEKLQRQKAIQLLSSALSLRLPGIDPTRMLNFVYPMTRWFFSRWFMVFVCLISIGALALILGNLDEFAQRLPDFQKFFAFQNIIAMGALLIITKTLHEFGHALFCKHFGGECHEIGFMFLVLMPCMYCDTSDSWRLPNKWHRMAIGAAGMYVEIVMAAFCTFIWWYTNPGWLHYTCLNIMFLCSVTTIMFNGNPLLRYDGYYILSDWLEVPNMSEKSKSAMLSKLRVSLLGMEPIPDRQLPQQNRILFAAYSILSVSYRWFVLIMILWFLSEMFKPYGLEAIGHFLIGLSLVGMVGMPGFKLIKFFSYPGRVRQVKKPRLIATLALLGGIVAVVFLVPFNYSVTAHLVVQPSMAQRVYVPLAGMLDIPAVKPGEIVKPNQLLARLRNSDEQIRLHRMSSRVALLEQEIARLNQMTRVSPLASTVIVSKKAELMGAKRQLDLQKERLQMLELRSNRSGIVIPPPNMDSPPNNFQGELPTWKGTPFDQGSFGARLERDTWFCSVAEPGQWDAVLMVPQSDINLVKNGDRTRAMLDEYPGHWITGIVRETSNDKVTQLPRELSKSAGGGLAAAEQSFEGETPLFDYYQVTVQLDSQSDTNNVSGDASSDEIVLAQGFRGRARIHVGKFTLAWRIGRFFKTVFNFS